MEFKKETETLLKNLKDLGIDRRQIEKDLDYREFYIDQLLSKGSNKLFLNRLKKYHIEKTTKEPVKETFQQQLLTKKNGDEKKVPVYGGFTSLGNIEVLDDENVKHKVIAELPANVFPGCDYAEKATGDSMYPLIMNQALLVGKVCTVKGISFGEKYIIKTKDGLDTTKFIHPGSKHGKFVLKAYNKSIPDQEIDIADIVFSCRVKWIINPT